MTKTKRQQTLEQYFRHLSFQQWIFYFALLLLLVLFAPFSPSWTSHWLFTSQVQDQHWRWLTAHLCHWSWGHWSVNIMGLLLFCLLYGNSLKVTRLAICIMGMLITSALTLKYFYLRDFYLGFSGLLYGLFTYGALSDWSRAKLTNSIVLIYLTVRTGYFWFFPQVQVGNMAGLPVAYELHISGMLGAVLCWLGVQVLSKHSSLRAL